MTEWLFGQGWNTHKIISLASSLIFSIALADSIIVSARRRIQKGFSGFSAMSFFTAWMVIASSAWIMAGALAIAHTEPRQLSMLPTPFKVIAAIGAIGFIVCMHWFDNRRPVHTIEDRFIERPPNSNVEFRQRKDDWQ